MVCLRCWWWWADCQLTFLFIHTESQLCLWTSTCGQAECLQGGPWLQPSPAWMKKHKPACCILSLIQRLSGSEKRPSDGGRAAKCYASKKNNHICVTVITFKVSSTLNSSSCKIPHINPAVISKSITYNIYNIQHLFIWCYFFQLHDWFTPSSCGNISHVDFTVESE